MTKIPSMSSPSAKGSLLFILILTLFFFCSGCTDRSSFYVSPDGDDRNQGTMEKPFATMERAVEAVRAALKKENHHDIMVLMKGGSYSLEKPLYLDPSDSGPEHYLVIFKAMPGEIPVISGGKEITGWERKENDIWATRMENTGNKRWNFRELFINGKRAPRARHPNDGYLRIAAAGEDKRSGFYFHEGDFPSPDDPGKVEIVFFHDWSISRIRVSELDENIHKITAVDWIGAKALDFFTQDNWEPYPRYYLENSISFLDVPWEWFLDIDSKWIYLKLPPGTDPNENQIIAPYTEQLVVLAGEKNAPVRNIVFDGITFSHCAFSLPEEGYAGIQAGHFDNRTGGESWKVIPACVEGRWMENCKFENCSWKHLGGSGLWIGAGSKNCLVRNGNLTDISGNGIMVGEGSERRVGNDIWWKSAPGEAAISNSVENCSISSIGQQFFGAVGIWSGITAETRLENNEIYGLPYTGISAGWLWGTENTPCRDLYIAGNHIHHVMMYLSDGGGIYTLGFQPGGVIRNNRIHDVEINAGRAESNGMFLDEGTSGITISGNLIYRIARSPLRFHRAAGNLVADNVLVCSNSIPPVRYNNTAQSDIVMQDNRVFSFGEQENNSSLQNIIDKWMESFRHSN